MTDTETKIVNVGFPVTLLARVDNFRFDNRFATRVEAIRWLIEAALDKKLKPEKLAVPKE